MSSLTRRLCLSVLAGSGFSALVALITTLAGIYLIEISPQSILLVAGTAGSVAGSLTAAFTLFKTRKRAPQPAE